jgi:S1-C subfamily serine protease
MRIRVVPILALLFALSATAAAAELADLRGSVYRIRATTQTPDFASPWRHLPSARGTGTGFYIGERSILTNAHVVSNSRFLTVQRDGDPRQIPARVTFIAHDADLAILTTEGENDFTGVAPLEFAAVPPLRSPVSTVGYPRGGEQISFTQGIVSRIDYHTYVHSGYHRHLLIQVDSAINPGNSGGPVVQEGKVVGVAFQSHRQAENTGYIIPTPVVRRFLDDVRDGRYDGHPEVGIAVQEGALANPATATFHRLGEQQGVKVAHVAREGSALGHLAAGDILLAVDGHPIDVDGRVWFGAERVRFQVLPDLKQVGDEVSFTVHRDGELREVAFPLRGTASTAAREYTYAKHPRFCVFGGLVFQAVSRSFFQAWSERWDRRAPVPLRYLAVYSDFEPAAPEEVIVLSGRLPHRVNRSVGDRAGLVVASVDGRPVRRLEELADRLRSGTGEYIEIGFWGDRDPVVLSRAEVLAANAAINLAYAVEPECWFGDEVAPPRLEEVAGSKALTPSGESERGPDRSSWDELPGSLPEPAAASATFGDRLERERDPGKRGEKAEQSVVQVWISQQKYDVESPWLKEQVTTGRHLGAVVSAREILLPASAVADATYIEMGRLGSSRRQELRVRFVDHEANLALLVPVEHSALAGLLPLSLAEGVPPGTRLEALEARGSSLERLSARVTEIVVEPAAASAYPLTQYALDRKPAGGQTTLLLQGERLAGLVVGGQSSARATPAPLLRHFLEAARSDAYRGLPSLELETTPLVSAELRRFLGADGETGGVRVQRVHETSPFRGLVEEGDVLLEVAGAKIDSEGFFRHGTWGRIPFQGRLNELSAGTETSVVVLRGGKRRKVSAVLTRFDSNRALIPFAQREGPYPHLVVGGLLFGELSRPYLQSWGTAWEQKAPLTLLHLWGREDRPAEPRRVVVLQRVLCDPENRGYQDLSSSVVREVNGHVPASLDDLRRILREHPIERDGRRYARFVFEYGVGEVLLDYEALGAAHERIAAGFGVRSRTSFFTDVAKPKAS